MLKKLTACFPQPRYGIGCETSLVPCRTSSCTACKALALLLICPPEVHNHCYLFSRFKENPLRSLFCHLVPCTCYAVQLDLAVLCCSVKEEVSTELKT